MIGKGALRQKETTTQKPMRGGGELNWQRGTNTKRTYGKQIIYFSGYSEIQKQDKKQLEPQQKNRLGTPQTDLQRCQTIIFTAWYLGTSKFATKTMNLLFNWQSKVLNW